MIKENRSIEVCGICSRPLQSELDLSEELVVIDGMFYEVSRYSNGNIKFTKVVIE